MSSLDPHTERQCVASGVLVHGSLSQIRPAGRVGRADLATGTAAEEGHESGESLLNSAVVLSDPEQSRGTMLSERKPP